MINQNLCVSLELVEWLVSCRRIGHNLLFCGVDNQLSVSLVPLSQTAVRNFKNLSPAGYKVVSLNSSRVNEEISLFSKCTLQICCSFPSFCNHPFYSLQSLSPLFNDSRVNPSVFAKRNMMQLLDCMDQGKGYCME